MYGLIFLSDIGNDSSVCIFEVLVTLDAKYMYLEPNLHVDVGVKVQCTCMRKAIPHSYVHRERDKMTVVWAYAENASQIQIIYI